MALYVSLLMVARLFIGLLILVQFSLVLITGHDNVSLRNLGQELSQWVYQILMFLTFNNDNRPFPFDEWPKFDYSAESSTYSFKQREATEADVSDHRTDAEHIEDEHILSPEKSDSAGESDLNKK
jgi:hypothetical protein